MKKALLLVSILFVSVFSTACINNFAVQELNSKAKSYLEEGDYNAAIERLKSSIDLDDTIFETHYNLAVAYTQADDYMNAMNEYKKAVELNPDVPDSYYSLAVAQENLAVDLMRGTVRLDENGRMYHFDSSSVEEEQPYSADENVIALVEELKADAAVNYGVYLEKSPDASDAEDVRQKLESLKSVPDVNE